MAKLFFLFATINGALVVCFMCWLWCAWVYYYRVYQRCLRHSSRQYYCLRVIYG